MARSSSSPARPGGIGRALTAAFVAEGARVAALDLVAAEHDGAGESVFPIACDVADAAAFIAAWPGGAAAATGFFHRLEPAPPRGRTS